MAKILLLNGSAHQNGCTATALQEMEREFFTSFPDGK